jgi:hypothetical protein
MTPSETAKLRFAKADGRRALFEAIKQKKRFALLDRRDIGGRCNLETLTADNAGRLPKARTVGRPSRVV